MLTLCAVPLPGLGACCRDQDPPAQVSTWLNVLPEPLLYEPTAMHRDEVGQRTSLSMLTDTFVVPPGAGTRTRDHFVPFQRRTSSSVVEPTFAKEPTAQQLRTEMQVTSVSSFCEVLPIPAGSGVPIAVHLRPFQCSMALSVAPPLT